MTVKEVLEMGRKARYTLSLGLGDRPCSDMGIAGKEVEDTDGIRKYADLQQVRLHEAADTIDKLKSKGWLTCGLVCAIWCSKTCTENEATADLKGLGLSAYSQYLEEE